MHPKLEHTSTSRSKWRHRQEYNYSRGLPYPTFNYGELTQIENQGCTRLEVYFRPIDRQIYIYIQNIPSNCSRTHILLKYAWNILQ